MTDDQQPIDPFDLRRSWARGKGEVTIRMLKERPAGGGQLFLHLAPGRFRDLEVTGLANLSPVAKKYLVNVLDNRGSRQRMILSEGVMGRIRNWFDYPKRAERKRFNKLKAQRRARTGRRSK